VCLIQIALSQLAQFNQLKTKGNGQTIGAPTATERREIHRESAFRWNETKNKAALRTASRRNETKNKTVLGTSGNKTKTKTLACQPIVLSRTRQRNKRSHQRAGNKDAERYSPNDRKRCRIRDRSHQSSKKRFSSCRLVNRRPLRALS
jgi:hypothetical protein